MVSVVGELQMTLEPVVASFSCFPLPIGTCQRQYLLDKRFMPYCSMGEEQPYIKSGESVGELIEHVNNSSKNQLWTKSVVKVCPFLDFLSPTYSFGDFLFFPLRCPLMFIGS